MTKPRPKPTKAERIAACLLEITRNGKPIVTREEAKHLTAGEVYDVFMERVDIDHIVPRGLDGPDHHANYQPLLRATDHKIKTKRDRKMIDKAKRIIRTQQEHGNKILAKISVDDTVAISSTRRRSSLRSRPMPGTKASGLKRKMNGTVERRAK